MMTILNWSSRAITLIAIAAAQTAFAEVVVLQNATVHTETARGTIEHASVVITDGRVTAVGADAAIPAGAQVIDVSGKVITPGLFGGTGTVGLDEVPQEASTVDSALRLGKMYPEFDLSLAYNPDASNVGVARADGIAFAMLVPSARSGMANQPGGSIVAGLGSVVSLAEKMARAPSLIMVDIGSSADALSGGSRAGQFMLLKRAFAEARAPRPANGGADLMLTAAGHDTLAQFLKQKKPFMFAVDRAADIRQLIGFAKREGIRVYIEGGVEAWRVADELKLAGIPVFLNPFADLPETFDELGASLENAARLHKAGVTVAFSLGEPSPHRMRRVRQAAGIAVANGLPWPVALDAITRVPAQLFGVAGEFGSIETGREANLVVWSGDPFEVTTLPERMWAMGQPQSLHSRQTELRDRYLELNKQNIVH